MRVTVDRVGRIVIPKAIRQALGIGPDAQLELVQDGTGLRLDPVSPSQRAITIENGFPKLAFVPGAVLSDDDVRNLRDELNR